MDRNTGEPLLQEAVHEQGRPNCCFYNKTESWWTTNLKKAILAQAGSLIYKCFQPFNMDDTEHFIGLLMFHGLAPSPRILQKFHSQEANPVNGNGFFQ